jgi:3-phytase
MIRQAMRFIGLTLVLGMSTAGRADSPSTVRAVLATAPVAIDADDPALWVCPTDSNRSLILGTNKAAAPAGALYVFALDGSVRQVINGLDRPNNVDVEYGFALGNRSIDIAVVTERRGSRLRVYEIARADGRLVERSSLIRGGLTMFVGDEESLAAPMGVGLYRRPRDGAVFAIVSRKRGPRQGYLWQYRLQADAKGDIEAVKVREFGAFSGRGEIEAIAVDDPLGHVYYADEQEGIHKWQADPDHPEARRELALFGREGFRGDREGIGIYARDDGTGYIVCADQIPRDSAFHVFLREGEPGRPHDHSRRFKLIQAGADSTDGLEVTSCPVGAAFPNGLAIAMNSRDRNFLLYSWEGLAAGEPVLKIGPRTATDPGQRR